MTSMNFLISIPYRLNRKIFLIRLVIMTENIGFQTLKRSKELCDSNGVAGLRTDSSLRMMMKCKSLRKKDSLHASWRDSPDIPLGGCCEQRKIPGTFTCRGYAFLLILILLRPSAAKLLPRPRASAHRPGTVRSG